jgi:hypothetical protein
MGGHPAVYGADAEHCLRVAWHHVKPAEVQDSTNVTSLDLALKRVRRSALLQFDFQRVGPLVCCAAIQARGWRFLVPGAACPQANTNGLRPPPPPPLPHRDAPTGTPTPTTTTTPPRPPLATTTAPRRPGPRARAQGLYRRPTRRPTDNSGVYFTSPELGARSSELGACHAMSYEL